MTITMSPENGLSVVVDHLAKQLDITNKECILRYGEGETNWDHSVEIKRFYGYHDFFDPIEYFSLVRWLYTRAWVSNERPSVLFDLATARLVERKVLLPGVTVLARLISRVRARVADRLWQTLAGKVDILQRSKLEALLVIPYGTYLSGLDRLRRPPTRISGPALVSALNRLNEIRAIGVGEISLAGVPQSRIEALARHAAAVRTQAIARMTDERRIATLLAFAREFEIRAMDDAFELLDLLMTEIMREAESTGKKERIRTLRDLDAAALCLVAGMNIILNETYDDAELRKVIFARIPKEKLKAAAARVELPEVLLEIHARTGFANEFTHVSEANARVEDLPISICAALIAEACNIGIEPLIHSDNPALTRGRLEWVQQNYIRAENLIRANARLVEVQTHIPLAQVWSGGEVASADGLRFVVPVRTINAGPNSKYFSLGRGVTYYNFTSDQFTGFHSIVALYQVRYGTHYTSLKGCLNRKQP